MEIESLILFLIPGTVFDYETQSCNWPDNVKEPCGNIPTKKEKRKLETHPPNK